MNNIVIANLFKQKEPTVEKTLGSLLEIHNDFKFIKKIYRIYHYSDEPKFFFLFYEILLSYKLN